VKGKNGIGGGQETSAGFRSKKLKERSDSKEGRGRRRNGGKGKIKRIVWGGAVGEKVLGDTGTDFRKQHQGGEGGRGGKKKVANGGSENGKIAPKKVTGERKEKI